MVQAALESRAACTATAGRIEVEPVDEIKIQLKHCDQCLFLQSMLSASIFKSIFDFRIWIPNELCCTYKRVGRSNHVARLQIRRV